MTRNIQNTILYYGRWLLVTAFLLSLYSALLGSIDGWISKCWIGAICESLYGGICNSCCLNLFLSVLIPAYLFWRMYKTKDVKVSSLFVQSNIASAILVASYDNYWLYPTVVGTSWGYNVYLRICLFVFLPMSIIVYACYTTKRYFTNKASTDSKPFSNDDVHSVNEVVKKFAENIANRITVTKIQNESFAIGIAGQWGSGKTTYLKALEDALKDKVVYLKFMPWNSIKPEKIIEDCLSLLRDAVARNIDPSADKALSHYSKHLLSINRMDPWVALLRSLAIWHSDDDTNTSKKKIIDSLKESKKKIVVAIDDIDRLDTDELFEVLRLIRNTASFPNVIYIVTYDKDYVIQQLTNKRVSNPELYLEKIISVEVMLPKVSSTELMDSFYGDLKDMVCDVVYNDIKDAIECDIVNKRLLLSILKNYREVKRFARQLAVHATYAEENLNQELSLEDFLWIELIRYADYTVYEALSTETKSLLHFDSTSKQLRIKDSISKQFNADFKDTPSMSREVYEVLKYVFGVHKRKNSKLSIKYTNNYARYFRLSKENLKFYFHDLEVLLSIDDKKELTSVLASYFEKEDPNENFNIKSLLFLIEGEDLEKVTFVRFKTVLNLLFSLRKYETDNNVYILIHKILTNEVLIKRDNGSWLKWTLEYLHGHIKSDNIIELVYILRPIYDNTPFNKPDNEITKMVEDLLASSFTAWAENNHPDAVDIIDTQSTLYKVFHKLCTTWYEEDEAGNEIGHRVECIIERSLFKYFGAHKSSKLTQFDDYFDSSLSEKEMFEGVSPDEKADRAERRFEQTFDDYNLYTSYRKTCFILPSKEQITKQCFEQTASDVINDEASKLKETLLENTIKAKNANRGKPKPKASNHKSKKKSRKKHR